MRVTVIDGSSRFSFVTADDESHTLVLTLSSTRGVVLSQQLLPTAGLGWVMALPPLDPPKAPSPPTNTSSPAPHGDLIGTGEAAMTPLEAIADNLYERVSPLPAQEASPSPSDAMACGVTGCVCDLFESAVPTLSSVCSCGHGAMYHTRSRWNNATLRPAAMAPTPASPGLYGVPPSDARPPDWADASCEDISRMGCREEALGDWHAAADPMVSRGYYQTSFRTQMTAMHSLCRAVNEHAAGGHGAEALTDTHVVVLKGLLQRCASLAEKSSYA